MCDLTLFLDQGIQGAGARGRTAKQRERLERKLGPAPVPWAAPALLGFRWEMGRRPRSREAQGRMLSEASLCRQKAVHTELDQETGSNPGSRGSEKRFSSHLPTFRATMYRCTVGALPQVADLSCVC